MNKICPSCNRTFECRNDNILECWCLNEKIETAAREFMALNFEGCLCRDCIDRINKSLTCNHQTEIITENEKL